MELHLRRGSSMTAMLGAALVAGLVGASAVTAATGVQGSVVGSITNVKPSVFTLRTTLSPTGSSKITMTAKTTITAQASGQAGDAKKGMCVRALGTSKGTAIVATQLTISPSSGGTCNLSRGSGALLRTGNQGGNGGFTRPANSGFANGEISAITGATLTVKGPRGTTLVTMSATTKISKTVSAKASAIKVKLCALVSGTSTDNGVSVTAQDVRLTQPVQGSCNPRRPGAA
jgi:hypothetical protein